MDPQVESLEAKIRQLRQELSEARRRATPERVSNYVLRNPDGSVVTLADLFGERDDLLVVHNMGGKCAYCTLWADGFSGYADHLENRCAFVLASPDEPAALREFAKGRGWRFRSVSVAGSTFSRDLGFESGSGEPWPGVSAFARQPDGTIVRTGRAEFGPGDEFCAVWPLFDLLRGGAGGWAPRLPYR